MTLKTRKRTANEPQNMQKEIINIVKLDYSKNRFQYKLI